MRRSERVRCGRALRAFVTVFTVTAVLVGTVEAVAAPPAAAEEAGPRTGPLPALESPAPELPAGSIPDGDFTDPPAPAVPVDPAPAEEREAPNPGETRYVPGESELVERTEFGEIYENPDGTQTDVASEGLVWAMGLDFGPDGSIYVSNFGVMPGMGQVVRIDSAS